jgi:hypothetical protein
MLCQGKKNIKNLIYIYVLGSTYVRKNIEMGRWFRIWQGSIAKIAKTELGTSSPGMVAPGVRPTYSVPG